MGQCAQFSANTFSYAQFFLGKAMKTVILTLFEVLNGV